MKNILTSSEMKKVDTETIERIGIPGIVLMERAALSVASLIMENEPVTKTVQVIAGVGNNGADGLAICRMLYLKGYNTIHVHALLVTLIRQQRILKHSLE